MPKKPQALVGGQAVIEGVTMRSPKGIATAVRRPNGTIAVRYRNYTPVAKRNRVLGLPIVRGGVTLVEAIVIGTQALFFSAEEASREEGQEVRRTPWWAASMENVTTSPPVFPAELCRRTPVRT